MCIHVDIWCFSGQRKQYNIMFMNTLSLQRYFVNESFYHGGGPVFLMIGGEGTAQASWMVTGQWIKYAKVYNAFCVQLEHRYYGKSHPTR